MKAILLFSMIGLMASCKMGAQVGAQNESVGNNVQKTDAQQPQVVCEATSAKSGANIVEKATLTEKDDGYEIVYEFTTTTGKAVESGKEIIVGKFDSTQKAVRTADTIRVLLKDASMVTIFDGRDVKQSFEELVVSLEKGKLSLSDSGAAVLELAGCK